MLDINEELLHVYQKGRSFSAVNVEFLGITLWEIDNNHPAFTEVMKCKYLHEQFVAQYNQRWSCLQGEGYYSAWDNRWVEFSYIFNQTVAQNYTMFLTY